MANTESEKILQNHYEWCLKEGRSTSWRASDKIKKNKERKLSSGQADKREGGPTSEQAHNLHANNSTRFVKGAQAQLGRKPKSAR